MTNSDRLKPRLGGGSSGLLFVLLFVLVLLFGIGLNRFVTDYAEKQERHVLLNLVSAMVPSIDPGAAGRLTASSADIGTPYLASIKTSLAELLALSEDYAFVYLMGKKGDDIVFLADAEDEGSEDYSAPGEVYQEASAQLQQIFIDQQAFVEGPVVDSYGTWISAHAPIFDPQTGRLIAIIGADISARHWQKAITVYQLFANSITLLLAVIIAVFMVLLSRTSGHRNRLYKLNLELEESLATVKTLEGVIPICMHCKGIRDDKESWHKLELYISRHSEAEFSHGICPDCMEKYHSVEA